MNASLRRSIIAFLGWVILSVWAVTGQPLRFEIDPITGTVTITGDCPNGLGTLSIPDTIDGRRVTGVGDYAFYRCLNLTGVVMPEGVARIGRGAFAGCTRLAKVVIPDSVSTIGDAGFAGCISLTSVTIPQSVTIIWREAFSGCTNLTAIEVDPANPSYSSVDGVVFNQDRSELVLCPNGRSGSYSIPDGVARIGRGAFAGCISLTSVTIPRSVTNIASEAFSGCLNLIAIEVDPANPSYSSGGGVVFNQDRSELVLCPSGKSGSYSIPDGVARIGTNAFLFCNRLTRVAIPGSVTGLGGWTFYSCYSLTNVTVDPANPSYSSSDGVVFNRDRSELVLCPNGKSGSYSIPDGVARIGNHAFASCFRLTGVTLPSTVTNIEDGAFASCFQLTSIMLPSTVTNIGDYTFAGCIQLTSITIPSDVSSIGLGAFQGCIRLWGAFFQGNAPNAGPFEFGEAGLTIYYLPGTTGWRSTFGSRPTAVWTNPLVSAGTVRADGSGFAFRISWAPNATLVVEASPDLASPAWSPIGTNTPAYGSWDFSDPEWVRHPSRFYRVRLP